MPGISTRIRYLDIDGRDLSCLYSRRKITGRKCGDKRVVVQRPGDVSNVRLAGGSMHGATAFRNQHFDQSHMKLSTKRVKRNDDVADVTCFKIPPLERVQC